MGKLSALPLDGSSYPTMNSRHFQNYRREKRWVSLQVSRQARCLVLGMVISVVTDLESPALPNLQKLENPFNETPPDDSICQTLLIRAKSEAEALIDFGNQPLNPFQAFLLS